MHNLWIAALAVFVLNLPFGFWRAGVRKLSVPWFMAIHLPVPLVVAIRFMTGLGWHLVTFPVLISAFFSGQFIGGKLRCLWS
ncbi:MAG: hypothetical protein DRH37_01140 [Deltaproteobacteria bacterium]|nr:MAG: hypothetical protein DRH37_01140 [Deltaproteobacteria bacterium]